MAAVLAACICLSACTDGRPWNVLLVTFDTTRADFIGCYGRSDARTPTLDGLAAGGTLFEHAYASNPVTQPSHSTILTGTYPLLHGVRDNGMFRLPEVRSTLAEILGGHGYATGAAIGGFPLTREFGTDQGFDFYDDDLAASRLDQRGQPGQRQYDTWYDERPAGHVNDAILPWLRRHVADTPAQPFFVWLHYWDPHEPHIAPAPFGQLFAHEPYLGEIAYADASFGSVLEVLRSLGEFDRTLVVMTADHGEGRYQHDEVTHAFLAYDTTLHVPLIVRPPAAAAPAGQRVAERVGTVDIVPTVLGLLGFEIPADVQGRSLAPLVSGEAPERDRDVRPYYSESLSPRLSHGFGELRVLFRGPYKYIYGPRPELYRLDRDPDELHDLSTELSEQRAALEADLRRFLDEHSDAAAADAVHETSEETRRQLAALGYLSTAGEAPSAVAEALHADGLPPQDRVGDINLQTRLRQALSRGAFGLAQRTAATLLEGSPDNPFYRAKLAAALLGLGETAQAADVVDQTDPLSAAAMPDFLAVARALADAGQVDRALAMARRLTAADETVAGQLVLGQLLRRRGDTEAFAAAMARALELEPDAAVPRLELAASDLEAGSPAAAREQLRQVLDRYPVHAGALVLMARVERAEGRAEQALVHLARALSLAPESCDARLEQVAVLVQLGRRSEADQAVAEIGTRCDDDTRQQARALLDTPPDTTRGDRE